MTGPVAVCRVTRVAEEGCTSRKPVAVKACTFNMLQLPCIFNNYNYPASLASTRPGQGVVGHQPAFRDFHPAGHHPPTAKTQGDLGSSIRGNPNWGEKMVADPKCSFQAQTHAHAQGKGKEWGICPYRPPADQCLILRGHAIRWNSRDPGLSVLYVSTEPVSYPLLLSRADTKDRTRAPDGVKAMHPPPYR